MVGEQQDRLTGLHQHAHKGRDVRRLRQARRSTGLFHDVPHRPPALKLVPDALQAGGRMHSRLNQLQSSSLFAPALGRVLCTSGSPSGFLCQSEAQRTVGVPRSMGRTSVGP